MRTECRIADLQAESKSGQAKRLARKSGAGFRNTRSRSVATAKANRKRTERGRDYTPREKVWINYRFAGMTRTPHAERKAAERRASPA